jgi:beta-lactamase superfamily II metal-dependent hydrolase
VKKADVLICTHGHGDHIGDAVDVGKKLNPIPLASSSSACGCRKRASNRSPP